MFPIRDHNPSGRTPFVTYALLAINIVVFFSYVGFIDNARLISPLWYDWAMIPARLSQGEALHTLLTSQFLHGGWMHLIGNMLFLFIFGDNIEDEMGHGPFLVFYLASGVAAALVQYASEPLSQVPMVGASGAIAGVMGSYLLLFPRARVDIFIFFIVFIRIIPIPAWIVLGIWFASQFFNGLMADTGGGGVAYWAHAGGFIAGFLLTLPVWVKRGATGYWRRTHGHPPHPEARYRMGTSNLPKIRARKNASRIPRIRRR